MATAMEFWSRRRILVLGMTYPSYSRTYVETTCTGGIDGQTGRMVRLHPIPRRYLEPGQRFSKFQWITADVAPHSSDPRPESLRVEPNSIRLEEVIPAARADERRRLIEASPHLFGSVEALREQWERDGTSLGVIRPRAITGVRLVRRSDDDRAEWLARERELLAQEPLGFERRVKPLDYPEVEFRVSWTCNDARCNGHSMGMMQWGLHELYRGLASDPEREAKVVSTMRRELDLATRDVFLFLGNFRTTMWNFGLMDSFSPGRARQLSLF